MARRTRVRVSLMAGVVLLLVLAAQVAVAGPSRGTARYPDIQEEVPNHLSIQNEQQHEMLRFTTSHINLGQGNLQVRGGGQIAPCVVDGVAYDQCTIATQEILDANGNIVETHPAGSAVFHPEHNHWHMSAVATFEVRQTTLTGPIVALGEKVTFCLVDVEPVDGYNKKQYPRTYWECNGDLQGIAVGWLDSYHQSTQGQELDVTGLPEGIYYLTHIADPLNHWVESNESNNLAWTKFYLSRKGANPEITILSTSPCSGATCGNGGNP
jgi:hypothetical protein